MKYPIIKLLTCVSGIVLKTPQSKHRVSRWCMFRGFGSGRTSNCMPTCITLIRLNPTDNASPARNVFLCCVRSNEEDRRGLRDDRPPICRGDVSIQRGGCGDDVTPGAGPTPSLPQHSLPDKILLETSPTPHPSGWDRG